MAQITVDEDCDSIPRKWLIKEFNLNCIEGNIESALESLAEGIRWNAVGLKVMVGKAEIAQSLHAMTRTHIKEYTLSHILVDGNKAASNGVMRLENGDTITFCDFYLFDENARITEITTLGIRSQVMG